ncbi:[FeFe] hydrogenase H-cluster maturation GTPase HydF [Acetivibrio clariflavus]|uniref:Hydrogenase maturation GTPase HydF n=1 Tax=Acetivibrio clariflavus (strain DSM 19732 / NBRC 101661 / EBR45) TaxID=720554 RepID=G8M2U6_ACECE|nr:[FeFe] hydrogenase H-cluster maturation GTPase HydF [Acetivibrio clariflavus]AEV68210.1 hydrogenase maturation GTPase HydF [Acetivibrio clariflavus DSM 19732]
MNNTPIGNRLHIAIFGRRNAGKSTLINALTGQEIAVVSDVPGTTTDPVYKTMELLPLGPVVIIDTAGIDDVGHLGNLRVEKTYDVLRKTNFAIYVVDAEEGLTEFDKQFIEEIKSKEIPVILVLNKSDKKSMEQSEINEYKKNLGIPVCEISSINKQGIEELKQLIAKHAKFDEADLTIVGDLINPGDVVVLVTPIDKAAPKGRLILPQQQTIRDIIENDAIAVVTKEYELKETFESLNKKPSLVITDSQVFLKVSADTPEDIRLTSFSILFARYKGELIEMVKGLKKIEQLKEGSRVLIVEGCTHHRQADDIGKVKIPRWIRQMSGSQIEFEWASGNYFPKDIERFDLIIHCGGCMLNKLEMQYRINLSRQKGVAITNYGMLIAAVQGILKRALKPFPSAYVLLEE